MQSKLMRRAAGVLIVVALGCGKKSDAPSDKPKDKAPSGPPKIAITPVGKSKGSAVQKLISTADDTLSSADGRLTIEIPSGALATAETLSIQTISNEAPGGVGTAYRLGPEGTTFTTPVKLTFNYSAKDLRGTVASALKVAYQGREGSWNAINRVTRDEGAKLLTVETLHFSDWSLVAGYQLRPPSALVKQNELIQLILNSCAGDGDEELSSLSSPLYECRAVSPDALSAVDTWTVNSIENGNSTVGTVENRSEVDAVYHAPSVAPKTGNPVAVTASLVDLKTRRKMLLTSSIAIELKPALAGTIKSTQIDEDGRTITTIADVVFTWDESEQMYRIDGVKSFFDVKLDVVSGNCETHAEAKNQRISTLDGRIMVTEIGYLGSGATDVVLTGKQGCNGNKEPLSLPETIKWWPSPSGGLAAMNTVTPEGDFEGLGMRYVNEKTGEKIYETWSLVPQAP